MNHARAHAVLDIAATRRIAPSQLHELAEYVRACISARELDAMVLHKLLRNHPRYNAKGGADAIVRVRNNPHFGQPELILCRRDGQVSDISWVKALEALKASRAVSHNAHDDLSVRSLSHASPSAAKRVQTDLAQRHARERVLGALREEVFQRSMAYDALQSAKGHALCEVCALRKSEHIDHLAPTFDELVLSFLRERNIAMSSLPLREDATGTRYRIENPADACAWVDHHDTRATLRLTCARCNLCRPRKRKHDHTRSYSSRG